MSRSYNVHRRKTDLMPTIPSPRDTCRSSLGTYTPRTPGSKTNEDEKRKFFEFFSDPCLSFFSFFFYLNDAMFF